MRLTRILFLLRTTIENAEKAKRILEHDGPLLTDAEKRRVDELVVEMRGAAEEAVRAFNEEARRGAS